LPTSTLIVSAEACEAARTKAKSSRKECCIFGGLLVSVRGLGLNETTLRLHGTSRLLIHGLQSCSCHCTAARVSARKSILTFSHT
jgi:hypothetical protein